MNAKPIVSPKQNRGTGVRRVTCIDIRRTTVRDIIPRGFGEAFGEPELWQFEMGAQLAVGEIDHLDADPPVISRRLAADLIRAGDAMAATVRNLEEE